MSIQYHISLHSVSYAVTLRSSVLEGIILAHDLTNKKSYANLRKIWLPEVLAQGKKNAGSSKTGGEYDPEQFAGENIPVLVVGTKLDQISLLPGKTPHGGTIAADTGSDSISVDCTNSGQFTVGTQNMIKLNHFFDKVIEWKYFPKQQYQSTPSDMRRPRRSSKIQ
jgi:Rab-like protein 3